MTRNRPCIDGPTRRADKATNDFFLGDGRCVPNRYVTGGRFTLRVIIADDEPLWLRRWREVLTKAFERPIIEETNCGREAIQKVVKNEHDIAIVGTSLADIDSLDLFEGLMRMRPKMPVLDPGRRIAAWQKHRCSLRK